MKNTFIFSSLFVAVAAFLMAANVSFAGYSGQYGQYGQYGGNAQSQSIIIDKTVSTGAPTKGGVINYVDNLSPSDPRYAPGQNVLFRLKVKNTSDVTLENITVKDFLPGFVEPVEGPGTFDKDARTVTYAIDRLKAGEEKIDTLTMRIVSQEKLPQDKGLLCMINRAQVSTNSISDDDTAQFCVEKVVTGVSQVPTAGPEFGLALLAGSFGTLLSGLKLRKRS